MVQQVAERLILVTNDDGIDSQGLKVLFEVMKEFGKVVMISSKEGMSGKSMAITAVNPLRAHLAEETDDYKVYVTNGTPTDCVKLSINSLLDKKPDLIVSGINQGANSSVSVLYSNHGSGHRGMSLRNTLHRFFSRQLFVKSRLFGLH